MQDKKVRVKVSEQGKEERLTNFNEVTYGYTKEEAMQEANRCLQCKTRPCTKGCPVNNNIPEFIAEIAKGNMEEAYKILEVKNNFPAICGRVCPQENQCEGNCVRGIKGEAVAIGLLERFCADWHMSHVNNETVVETKEERALKKAKVAVIGAGPAGLACARDLGEKGYDVTIYESLDFLGGVLAYGIPKFRLPEEVIDKEIEYIKSLGVKIITNKKVGKDITIDEIYEEGNKAIFLGVGANKPRMMNIEGEDLEGVYSSYDYLKEANLSKENNNLKIGDRVVIIGGGNVAMDAARLSKRLGAKEVVVLYRRTMEEMPARRDEIAHTQEEGVEFKFLTNPVKFISNDRGEVEKVECVEMELGNPDESGRRRPIEKEGSNFYIDTNTVVVAVGQLHEHHVITEKMEGVSTHQHGGIYVEEETMETSVENMYAGGDVVTGGATVIGAIKAGKKAAKAIDEKIKQSK